MTFIEAAQQMIERNVNVFPLHASSKKPLLKDWPNLATKNLETIKKWDSGVFDVEDGINEWANGKYTGKNMSVGAACALGEGNLCVLDIDAEGVQDQIVKEIGDVFNTLTVQSRPDSAPYKRHFYFWQTKYSVEKQTTTIGATQNGNRYDWKINGQTVAAGSIHSKTGKPYIIEKDVPIASIPDSLVDWLISDTNAYTVEKGAFTPISKDEMLGEKQRYPYLLSKSVKLRMAGLPAESIYKELRRTAIENCVGGEAYANEIDSKIHKMAESAETNFNPEPILFMAEQKKFKKQWIRAEEVIPEKIEWLWSGRLPLKSTIAFAGDPSVAKTTMALDIIARGSVGAPFLDGVENDIGAFESILLSAEDDPSSIVIPRLLAAGADLSKVHLPQPVKVGKDEDEMEREIRLDTDLAMIKEQLEFHPKIKLIVIDPVSNYCGDKNINSEQEIRQIMMPLSRLAQQFNVAIVCIFHNSKYSGRAAMHKVIGAVGNIGACRMGWSFMKNPENTDEKLMLQMKENLGKFDGIVYTTESVPLTIGNEVSQHAKIKFISKTDLEANAVVHQSEDPLLKSEANMIAQLNKLVPVGTVKGAETVKSALKAYKFDVLDQAQLKNIMQKLGIVEKQEAGVKTWHRPNPEEVKIKNLSETGTDGDLG